MGPWAYLQHLASTPRLPFTAAYFGSLGLTLYFSIGVSHTCAGILPDAHAKPLVAPKHPSYVVCGACPVGFPDMVSRELLPDGLQRTAPCEQLRCSQGSSLDDKLRNDMSHGIWAPKQTVYRHYPRRCTLCTLCKVVVCSQPDFDTATSCGENVLRTPKSSRFVVRVYSQNPYFGLRRGSFALLRTPSSR
jgi:hypothetical protein